MKKIVNEVKGMLEAFGYGPVEFEDQDGFYALYFHVERGSETMCTRHKDAISLLLKGYLNAFHYSGDRQYVIINKIPKGIDPDDNRYSCLISEMIRVKDNNRTEEEVKGKEIFVNMYDHFERLVFDKEEAKDRFLNAIDEWNARSERSKQNEALTAEFSRVTDDMIELYSRKNLDYGNSFGRTYQELGLISAVTRINDKVERLKRLATHPDTQQVHDESIDDTLTDLACYAVMTLMERRREKGGKDL